MLDSTVCAFWQGKALHGILSRPRQAVQQLKSRIPGASVDAHGTFLPSTFGHKLCCHPTDGCQSFTLFRVQSGRSVLRARPGPCMRLPKGNQRALQIPTLLSHLQKRCNIEPWRYISRHRAVTVRCAHVAWSVREYGAHQCRAPRMVWVTEDSNNWWACGVQGQALF